MSLFHVRVIQIEGGGGRLGDDLLEVLVGLEELSALHTVEMRVLLLVTGGGAGDRDLNSMLAGHAALERQDCCPVAGTQLTLVGRTKRSRRGGGEAVQDAERRTVI